MSDVSTERLRIAERCLIGAAADRPELLTDDSWQAAMLAVRKMLTTIEEKGLDPYALARNPKV